MHKNQYISLSDDELLQHYQTSGEKEWLGILLQRYTLLLFGVAMKYLKDKHLAEDAVQQLFLKAFVHIPSEPIQNFKGWLYILLRNHCLQQLRTKEYLGSEEKLQLLPQDDISLKDAEEKEISLTEMHEALSELKEEQRITVELFYLKKRSYQQIMDCTGFNFMQVKSYIQNGKRNLKLILTQKLKDRNQ